MNDEWETPQWLFDQLNEEFHFTVDAAASKDNYKYYMHYNKEIDALTLEGWGLNDTIWLNPPYSNPYPWVAKAWKEAAYNTVVMLLPATTGVRWFHEFVWHTEYQVVREHVSIRFLPGRVKFVGASSTPRFDSVIVIFWNRHAQD